jgi:hypothetical protein
MELLTIAVLLLTLVVTVGARGLFYAIYLLLKRITAIPVDFRLPVDSPIVPTNAQPLGTGDQYTPEDADRTVPLEKFTPNSKKPLKVIFNDEDQVTPQEEDAKD